MIKKIISIISILIMAPIKYLARVKQLVELDLQQPQIVEQKHKVKEEQDERLALLRKKINSQLYIDVEYDEITQIVYLVLNRTSFAISLEEFAEFTINLNTAFNSLVQHPNILLAMEKDEETNEEIKTFIYMENNDNGFLN